MQKKFKQMTSKMSDDSSSSRSKKIIHHEEEQHNDGTTISYDCKSIPNVRLTHRYNYSIISHGQRRRPQW